LTLQKPFVYVFDRFPIQLQMSSYFDDGHKPTQVVNIKRQALGYPQIRMKQLQILDTDLMTFDTKQFAIPTGKPHFGSCQVQIANRALCPTVDSSGFLAATLTNGLKAFVGLRLNARLGSIGQNLLIDNFDSTKGEIRCYSQCGHRRPPLYRFFLCR
jgi:hypothetical protein